MKIFCDTNVIVAASSAQHPHHASARSVIERVKKGKDEGFAAAHSLAESYAVLTRLPGNMVVPPSIAWELIKDNVLGSFTVIALTPTEYEAALQHAAGSGIEGGK